MRGTGGLVALLVLVAACSPGHGEGAQCRFGSGGSAGGTINEACEDGLYCSETTDACTRPAAVGEVCNLRCSWSFPCDTFCEEGLFCDSEQVCQAPGPSGFVCRNTGECATGLICNQGYLPDDPTLGECAPPSQVGEPCFYVRKMPDIHGGGYGCAPGLVCIPPTETRDTILTIAPNQDCDDAVGTVDACGFPGTCDAPFTVPIGEGCLEEGSCVQGATCNLVPPPIANDHATGFGCIDDACWTGPWPGLCGPVGARLEFEDCTAAACAPGFLCDTRGFCSAMFTGELLVRCDLYETGELVNDFCAIGRHCEGDPALCESGELL